MKYRCDTAMRKKKSRRLRGRYGNMFAEGWHGCDRECRRCNCGMKWNGSEWQHNSYRDIERYDKAKKEREKVKL